MAALEHHIRQKVDLVGDAISAMLNMSTALKMNAGQVSPRLSTRWGAEVIKSI